MERHPRNLARINLTEKKKLQICNCSGFNFHSERLLFVIFVPVITRLLLLLKTISEPISAFMEKKNAEEHLDHSDPPVSRAAGSDECWSRYRRELLG